MVNTAGSILRFAKVTSSVTAAGGAGGGGTIKALYTPKGLYKYLFRKCDKLPNHEIKLYYKHHIRQGFIQYADEPDQERVTQIINQAVKDIDWVLKKLRKVKMDHSGFNLQVSRPAKFFQALSAFFSRPELILPHVRSAEIEWSSVPLGMKAGHNKQIYNSLFDTLYSSVYHGSKASASLFNSTSSPVNIADFSMSLSEEAIKMLLECNDRLVEFRRNIHLKPRNGSKLGSTFKVKEVWDFTKFEINVMAAEESDTECAPLLNVEAKYNPEKKLALIRLYETNSIHSSFPGIGGTLINFYQEIVIPKLQEWLSDHYRSHPCSLTRLHTRPLTYVNNQNYWLFCDLLKAGPAAFVKQIWEESTDPVKFVSEDVGIASYIASFIYGTNSKFRSDHCKESIEILDLGCGNGLLCFFLNQILCAYSKDVKVLGVDIRSRKIWRELLKQPNTSALMNQLVQQSLLTNSLNPVGLQSSKIDDEISFDLVERTFVPHYMDDLIETYHCDMKDRPKKSLWIIGNHSDELTPWIPVVARRLNATGFFIIPCCLYDFFAKYQRYGSLPGSSNYRNYIEYICRVGDEYGYQPTCDKLRIPSTKNICIVGLDCSRKFENTDVLSSRVEKMLTQLREGDDGNSMSKFVPRRAETAQENPKVNKEIAQNIVHKIFSLLIKDWENGPKDNWYTGRENLTFVEIIKSMSPDERNMLKGKGNGLQTLVKSNKHIFTISKNVVKLRKPTSSDFENVKESSRDKIKTRVCYFFEHHPQGCPVSNDLCTYSHQKS